jgi:hypothetical protein
MIDYKFLFMTNESFKFIKGYEKYMISDKGRVFSIKSHRFLKPRINTKGYYYVSLSSNKIVKNFTIYRVIGLHFLENPENKEYIDHINNNRLDNRLENLRFVSSSENSMNRKISNKNTSGVKGISFYKKYNNKYRVQIWFNNKSKHIGYFNSLDEATTARRQKANELFKEFTNTCEKIN